MAAFDHLSPSQFRLFHGTTADLKPGDTVLPARTLGVARHWASSHKGTEAFATEHLPTARYFASIAAMVTGGSKTPHFVYEVEPVDPSDVRTRDLQREKGAPEVIEHRSKQGFRVKGKVWEGPEKS